MKVNAKWVMSPSPENEEGYDALDLQLMAQMDYEGGCQRFHSCQNNMPLPNESETAEENVSD